MKKQFFIIFLMLTTLLSRGQNFDSLAIALHNAYLQLSNKSEISRKERSEHEAVFDSLFPKNFAAFHALYGTCNLPNFTPLVYPLHSYYKEHIDYFCKTKMNGNPYYCAHEIIRLVQHGYYQAGAHALLRDHIRNYLDNSLFEIVYILNQEYPEGMIRQFWFFVVDTHNFEDETYLVWYQTLLKNVNDLNPLVGLSLVRAFSGAKSLHATEF